jgi:hypothetical protein
MTIQSVYKKIQLQDNNPLHKELSIYREGTVHQIDIEDSKHTIYESLSISAHDYTALFHYGIVERLNTLKFISETDHGLDSWDEAILPKSEVAKLIDLLQKELTELEEKSHENVMVGWVDDPEKISFWRQIDTDNFKRFLIRLINFTENALKSNRDMEFVM